MKMRVLKVWFAVMGVACVFAGNAQCASGVVRVSKEQLPGAKVIVVGRGYPPRNGVSVEQRRLLAQRAAVVDAYRNMSSTLNGISPYIHEGSGVVYTTGFVKGAEVTDMRYFENGKVEVDLVMPISLHANESGNAADWNNVMNGISRRGYAVYYTEKPAKQISEDEWTNMRQGNSRNSKRENWK